VPARQRTQGEGGKCCERERMKVDRVIVEEFLRQRTGFEDQERQRLSYFPVDVNELVPGLVGEVMKTDVSRAGFLAAGVAEASLESRTAVWAENQNESRLTQMADSK
jgi:hypothetical protein